MTDAAPNGYLATNPGRVTAPHGAPLPAVLVHKRLEGGKFVWPQVRDWVMVMSPAQLAALFEGLDWRLVRPERARRPLVAG